MDIIYRKLVASSLLTKEVMETNLIVVRVCSIKHSLSNIFSCRDLKLGLNLYLVSGLVLAFRGRLAANRAYVTNIGKTRFWETYTELRRLILI